MFAGASLTALLLTVLLSGCASIASSPYAPVAQLLPPVSVQVSGYVLDSVSKAPVPFVLVRHSYTAIHGGNAYHQYGPEKTYTDAKGYFSLAISLKEAEKNTWLQVRTVGYEGELSIPSIEPVIILLRRKNYQLRPVCTLAQADSIRINPYASQVPTAYNWLPGRQLAFFIKNTSPHAYHTLKSIAFRVFFSEGIRFRIYQFNGADQAPGIELLTENVLLCAGDADRWQTYHLEGFNITVPAKGFFVALEEPTGGSCCFCYPPMKNYAPTGPVIYPPCSFAAARNWIGSSEGGWRRFREAEECWPLYESAIKVELADGK